MLGHRWATPGLKSSSAETRNHISISYLSPLSLSLSLSLGSLSLLLLFSPPWAPYLFLHLETISSPHLFLLLLSIMHFLFLFSISFRHFLTIWCIFHSKLEIQSHCQILLLRCRLCQSSFTVLKKRNRVCFSVYYVLKSPLFAWHDIAPLLYYVLAVNSTWSFLVVAPGSVSASFLSFTMSSVCLLIDLFRGQMCHVVLVVSSGLRLWLFTSTAGQSQHGVSLYSRSERLLNSSLWTLTSADGLIHSGHYSTVRV